MDNQNFCVHDGKCLDSASGIHCREWENNFSPSEPTNMSTKSDAVNVRYVYLQDITTDRKPVSKTVKVSDHCNVDLDEDGYPLGIEII